MKKGNSGGKVYRRRDNAEKKLVYRNSEIDLSKINEEDRTIDLSVSSETPVMREFGKEILSHDDDAISREWLSSGNAPLLLDHDRRQQIGVIEKSYIDHENKMLRAKVRFSKSRLGSEIFEDVKDGIRTNISTGYAIKKTEDLENDRGQRVVEWQPFEVSVVSIPADGSVGVNRSEEPDLEEGEVEVKVDEEVEESKEDIKVVSVEVVNVENGGVVNMTGENKEEGPVRNREQDINKILDIGERNGCLDMAKKAIQNNMSPEQFDAMVSFKKIEESPLDVGVSSFMEEKEQQRYSVAKAIKNYSTRGELSGLEKEVNEEFAKQQGREARGFYVPQEFLTKRAVQMVGTDAKGGNIVGDDYRPDLYVDYLRANTVMGSLGMRVLSGLRGDLTIPVQTSATNVAFVDENTAPPGDDISFSQMHMKPKTMAQFVDMSRKLLLQSEPVIENIVRSDMLKSFALKIDQVSINGDTRRKEPQGILNNADLPTVSSGTNGGDIDYENCVKLRTKVMTNNAFGGRMVYLTNPVVEGAMRTTPRQGKGVEGNFILNDSNTILGHSVVASNLVPSNLTKGTTNSKCSALVFGDFSQIMLGMWGALEVRPNPYQSNGTGSLRIEMYQEVDVLVRNVKYFAALLDVTA